MLQVHVGSRRRVGLVAADLVHRRVRSELREVASGWWTVSSIARAFQDEGFAPVGDERAPRPGDPESWYEPGQRRGTFDQHAASVDWTDPAHVRRALAVFETLLQPLDDDVRGRVVAVLDRHGLQLDDRGRLRPRSPQSLASLQLHGLTEAGALKEHLERMQAAALTDPPLAVSAAKALVEATCKRVLVELGLPFDEKADLPVLVKQTNKALALEPRGVAPTAPGAETVTRVLANLAAIPIGLAELRNQYGPDHGRSTPTVGLHPRHAHLAVGCATTYVHFLLDTLRERTGVDDVRHRSVPQEPA
jgi:hypothetical protein